VGKWYGKVIPHQHPQLWFQAVADDSTKFLSTKASEHNDVGWILTAKTQIEFRQ